MNFLLAFLHALTSAATRIFRAAVAILADVFAAAARIFFGGIHRLTTAATSKFSSCACRGLAAVTAGFAATGRTRISEQVIAAVASRHSALRAVIADRLSRVIAITLGSETGNPGRAAGFGREAGRANFLHFHPTRAAALAFAIFASAAFAHEHRESWYADELARTIAGRTETRMPNGTRCDVLTATHSIEVEFAAKWCESIGQALNYASQTGRQPAVALILERESDARFLERLKGVVAFHDLPISIIVLKPFRRDGLEFHFPRGIRAVDLTQPVAEISPEDR